jgi:16S rRNA (cytosine1402-N4)-methyltransferase
MSKTAGEMVHMPVLLDEVVEFLDLKPGNTVIDATLGLGGHTEAILSRVPMANVVGIDQDNQALTFAEQRLRGFGDRVRTFHANFSAVRVVVEQAGIEKVDGIIADLGVSSMQLDDPARGFSFRHEAPLDMRMNRDSGQLTASALLETLDEEEIANLIYNYGEER